MKNGRVAFQVLLMTHCVGNIGLNKMRLFPKINQYKSISIRRPRYKPFNRLILKSKTNINGVTWSNLYNPVDYWIDDPRTEARPYWDCVFG